MTVIIRKILYVLGLLNRKMELKEIENIIKESEERDNKSRIKFENAFDMLMKGF